MRRLLLLLIALAAPVFAQDKPNVVILFADDLGYGDLSSYGHPVIRTPHLDGLASEGIRLTSFYSAPWCVPARAQLLMGRYEQRIQMGATGSGGRDGIPEQERTLAEALGAVGYRTAMVGKWHLGSASPDYLPTGRGFDSWLGLPYSNDMRRPWVNSDAPLWLFDGPKKIENPVDQDTLTTRYAARAVDFIQSAEDDPFFLYFAHTMPHWPQYASEEFAGKSKNGAWGDAVEEIDYSVGRILDRLRELDLEEKTLVLFFSDNGGALRFGASNGPLRAGKGTTWEGGHRSALIARWPGRVPAGTVNRELLTSMDLYPTFAAWAGVEPPSDRVLDGKDIRAFFTEDDPGPTPHLAYFYFFTRHLNAVRSGRWKLFLQRTGRSNRRYVNQPAEELYDLHADVGETKNVYREHPEVVLRLQSLAKHAQWDLGDGGVRGARVRAPGFVRDARTLTTNE